MVSLLRHTSLLCLLAFAACSNRPRKTSETPAASPEAQVIAQLANYEGALRQMNYDQVADYFAKTGEIENPGSPSVQGREAIRKFLKSFAGFRILESTARAESTIVDGHSARQAGAYAQTVIIPGGNTVRVRGRFEAHWSQESDGQWRLTRMQTTPSQ